VKFSNLENCASNSFYYRNIAGLSCAYNAIFLIHSIFLSNGKFERKSTAKCKVNAYKYINFSITCSDILLCI